MRILTKVSASLIAAVLAVASLAPVAQAQRQAFAVSMKVPFAFQTASGQHFEAGVYTIRVTDAKTMLIQRGGDSRLEWIQEVSDDGPPVSHGKAVFTHRGDKYYLHSISMAGNATQLMFGSSKAEKHQEVASQEWPTAVELAALQTGH